MGLPEMIGPAAAAAVAREPENREGQGLQQAEPNPLDPVRAVATILARIGTAIQGEGEPAAIRKAAADDEEPGDERAILRREGLAAAALAMEDYEGAIRHCSQVVKLRPDHFLAWFNLGVARHRVGDYQEAVFAYHQAFRLRPEDARSLVNLGLARHLQGDIAGAREAYQGALGLDPANVQALWNLGLLCEQEEEWEDAEALFQRLMDLYEHSRSPRLAYAGRKAPALPGPSGAAPVGWKTLPEDVWFRLGLCRYRRDNWPAAKAAFEQCLGLRRPWRDAELNHALCLLHLGRLVEAGEELGRMLEHHPDCGEALSGLGAVAVETGDWELALSVRTRLADLGCTDPELTFNIGAVLDRQGDTEQALTLYCEALEQRPLFPEALLNLGHVLQRQGRSVEAAECWRRAMGLDETLAAGYFEGQPAAGEAEP